MSAVCAAAKLGSLVGLDAVNNQLVSVQALGLSVGLGVLQQLEQKLCALSGPATRHGTGTLQLFVVNKRSGCW